MSFCEVGLSRKVEDVNLKRNVRDYLDIMEPIAVALDMTQRATCTIGECVGIWKDLKIKLEPALDNKGKKKIKERMSKILTPAHYLAYMLSPKYFGDDRLTEEEVDKAMSYVNEFYPESMYLLVSYQQRDPDVSRV